MLDAYIYTIAVPTRVRGIRNNVYETSEYIIYKIYFLEGKDNEGRLVTIRTALRELYFIDNLAADILIGNNVLISEGIDLLFFKQAVYIDSCGVDVLIKVRSRGPIIRRVICVKKPIIVPARSIAVIEIYHLDLLDRDFLFDLVDDSTLTLYARLIGKRTTAILVKNERD